MARGLRLSKWGRLDSTNDPVGQAGVGFAVGAIDVSGLGDFLARVENTRSVLGLHLHFKLKNRYKRYNPHFTGRA
jgi:hypothetical protein